MRRISTVLALLMLGACGELPYEWAPSAPVAPFELSREKRAELLRMYVAEYNATSWIYQTERKKKFVELMAQIGTDEATRFLIQECEKLGWDYHKNLRLFFIAALGKTENDLAADYLMKEYEKYNWDYQAERKAAIMDALARLASGRQEGGQRDAIPLSR